MHEKPTKMACVLSEVTCLYEANIYEINFCKHGWPMKETTGMFCMGKPGIEVIRLLCSTQLKFIMLINVKMPTIVGILTFISTINTTSESLKARKVFNFQHINFMSS